MSLTNLIKQKEVASRLKSLRPPGPRTLETDCLVPARSNRYMLIGTAFDYLLRFELRRRCPDAIDSDWVADRALARIQPRETSGGVYVQEMPKITGLPGDEGVHIPADDIVESVETAVLRAKESYSRYMQSESVECLQQQELAAHALRLAQIDGIVRARMLAYDFEQVEQEEVDDLVELLSVVPYDAILSKGPLVLNPVFGSASRAVGGADADFVAGGVLVEIKTFVKARMTSEHVDQLLGYYLLSLMADESELSFPPLSDVAIYFARHGHLWEFPTSQWEEHADFAETRDWFGQYVAERRSN